MPHFAKTLVAASAAAVAVAGCATLEQEAVSAVSETYHANLTGGSVVGNGDADGRAMAMISVTDEIGQVCWEMANVSGLGTITGAHIHNGVAGTNGSVVFPLEMSNEGEIEGCSDASQQLQNALEADPNRFYVQVHTSEYPNGAIRGQLMRR